MQHSLRRRSAVVALLLGLVLSLSISLALAQPAPQPDPAPAASPVAEPTPSAEDPPAVADEAAPAPESEAAPAEESVPPTPPAEPTSPSPTPAPAPALPTATDPWVVNFEEAAVHPAPDPASEPLRTLRQFTYLQLLGHEGDFVRVYDPRARAVVYVSGAVVGPVDAPPAYIASPPPPAVESIHLEGRVVGSAYLSFYPTPEPDAQTARLGHNASVRVAESVLGEDGETWYRTDDGNYLPASVVRIPRVAPRTFAGRWIDVDLAGPAMLTAYEGDRPILSTLTIHGTGRWTTPTGVFRIQRRVLSETMNSESIGIPRNAPGGYYLPNVLYTQYFLPTGESLHYNYWSSNFGYPGSHGCLGLSLADSEFLWHFAGLGTPVSIHY